MAIKPRLLSKSRFKIGSECPTKLYYTGKKQYGSSKLDNPFLEALAEGGFQVGELAKVYHPGGIEIESLNVDQAVLETLKHLKKDKVTLFEPAIQVDDLIVRVDILIKDGKNIELIEVKSKSFDPRDQDVLYNKTLLKKDIKKFSSEWEPYLLDVAFQNYVLKKAHPDWKVRPYLMLADKTVTASVEGLNQLFLLQKDKSGRSKATTKAGTDRKMVGKEVLVKLDVSDAVEVAYGIEFPEGRTFEKHVAYLASIWKDNTKAAPAIGAGCKTCEFRISKDQIDSGSLSGFQECWSNVNGLKKQDFDKPFVFDLWNFRKSKDAIAEGRVLLEDLNEDDIKPAPNEDEAGLSRTERQWLQVEKVIAKSKEPYIDLKGLSEEIASFTYPLNFIDFETSMVAIPFNKGRRPYEQIAFQFSHHILDEDGTLTHANQYLNLEQGKFPNFDFVRALKKALSANSGTIFRYAAHENTVLCQIRQQLSKSDETDRNELMSWIKTVTTSEKDEADSWDGSRTMVDLCELVKKYYYHPKTNGSNSIKKVLPAILSESSDVLSRYTKPIYGSSNGITSLNFKDLVWLQYDESKAVVDPYKQLPPVFSDSDNEELDRLLPTDSLADGGAAMTAYARMQFTEMSDQERAKISSALLKYCELDTFAMVLIYQYWQELVTQTKKKQKVA